MNYTLRVEYPFPPVGIVGAADGKNRRAFLCLLGSKTRPSTGSGAVLTARLPATLDLSHIHHHCLDDYEFFVLFCG